MIEAVSALSLSFCMKCNPMSSGHGAIHASLFVDVLHTYYTADTALLTAHDIRIMLLKAKMQYLLTLQAIRCCILQSRLLANTILWPTVGSMLVRRRRRQANIEQTLGHRVARIMLCKSGTALSVYLTSKQIPPFGCAKQISTNSTRR